MPRTAPIRRLLVTALLAAALGGCATPATQLMVSPWGGVGVHRFDTGVGRGAIARREAPLPTLERPLLSAPALAAAGATVAH